MGQRRQVWLVHTVPRLFCLLLVVLVPRLRFAFASRHRDMPDMPGVLRSGDLGTPSRRKMKPSSWQQQTLCHHGRWSKVLFHPFWATSMTCARPLSPGIGLNRAPFVLAVEVPGPSAVVHVRFRCPELGSLVGMIAGASSLSVHTAEQRPDSQVASLISPASCWLLFFPWMTSSSALAWPGGAVPRAVDRHPPGQPPSTTV